VAAALVLTRADSCGGGDARRDEEVDVEDAPQEAPGYGCVIFVANLPVVPPEKFDKLLTVVRKIYSQIGAIREGVPRPPPGRRPSCYTVSTRLPLRGAHPVPPPASCPPPLRSDGLWMPVDEATTQSKGHCFVEFLTPAEAQAAQEQTDGYKLDKAHVFRVNLVDDFQRFGSVAEEYSPPEAKPFEPRQELMSWLLDARGRDQFAVRFADETEIYWNDGYSKRPEEVYRRTFWTESFVQWSPRGNYMTTVHRQGIALWGGPSFTRLARMAHPGMQLVDFSPGERYVATCSVTEPSNPREQTSVTVNFFDVRSGRKLRAFTGGLDDFMLPGGGAGAGAGGAPGAGSRGGLAWPVFKWAGGGEDRFVAKLGKNSVSVYEAPGFGLLDKKSLKLDAVTDCCWSPAEALLAVFQGESNGGNTPARVSLWQLPGRTELRQKQLFSVCDARLFWHPQGDYLCVKVERFTKTKKSTYSGFELFRCREKGCPMDVLELENKAEKIVAFAWEPRGHRFACIHGDAARPDVSVYTMCGGEGGSKLKLITTLKAKAANALYWSPAGHHLLLAGLKGLNGQLEWWSADEGETLATAEHFCCTDIEWDPTGRFVATSVSAVHAMENGFQVWSFSGQLLYRLPRDRFFQFCWRPRPPCLLSAEQEKAIAGNLRTYSKRYDEQDALLMTANDAGETARRADLQQDWADWLRAKRAAMDSDDYKQRLLDLLGDRAKPADETQYSQETVEEEVLIEMNEEVIQFAGR
jgi:translation initiation factor 3 subunit B